MISEFQVQRHDLSQGRIVEHAARPLTDGEIRLAVDKFAFTSNNMTYGIAGDTLKYWQFFPPANDPEDIWGIIPVWAFAEVVESKRDQIPVGDRVYGYFPPATEVTMRPEGVSKTGFTDASSHRQALPPLYNRYRRVLAEPGYDPAFDIARVLLTPLQMTSFCLYDYLSQKGWFGANQVLILSASSKTSLGLAYGISADEEAPELIGLTSDRNAAFVHDTNLYDQVITYNDAHKVSANKPTVIVDMAGNGSLRTQLSEQLGDHLTYYIGVGLTHGGEDGGKGLGRPEPGKGELFFAPSYILERIKELGTSEFDARSSDYVKRAAAATFKWVSIEDHKGLTGLKDIYPDFVDGSLAPDAGHIITM